MEAMTWEKSLKDGSQETFRGNTATQWQGWASALPSSWKGFTVTEVQATQGFVGKVKGKHFLFLSRKFACFRLEQGYSLESLSSWGRRQNHTAVTS